MPRARFGGLWLLCVLHGSSQCDGQWRCGCHGPEPLRRQLQRQLGPGQLTSAGVNDHYWIVVDIYTTDSHGTNEYMCYPGPNNTGNLNEYCSGSTYGGNTQWIYSDMVDGTNVTTARVFVYTCSYFPNCPNYVASAAASQ